MTPSANRSAALMTAKLRAREPFVYVRLGDADVPWMMGRTDVEMTCDGEPNRPGLASELNLAWDRLCRSPCFLCGDLETMEDPATAEVRCDFKTLCDRRQLTMVHSEALLFHRLSAPLKDFYRAVRSDTRRKILVAPHRISKAAEFLRAAHVPIHSTHANEPDELGQTRMEITRHAPVQILLLVGGRASKILAGEFASTGLTIIELGSALDPLFYGQTRAAQVSQADARTYMAELWWE